MILIHHSLEAAEYFYSKLPHKLVEPQNLQGSLPSLSKLLK